MTMYIIWFVFPIVDLIVCFHAYREFKAMSYEQMGVQGGGGYGGMMRGLNRRNSSIDEGDRNDQA